MDVRELLEQVKSGSVEIEDAQMRLKNLPYEDLGYAKLDHHRKLRSGFGETVFCQGKPDAYLLEIYKKFYERDGEVLGTRASESQAELVRTAVPEVVYDPISRILKVEKPGKERRGVWQCAREARRTYRWPRKQPRPLNISDAGQTGYLMWELPESTGFWPRGNAWTRLTALWRWPEWKAPWAR